MRTVRFKPEEVAHLVEEDEVLKCTICADVYKPRRRIRFHRFKWKAKHVRCAIPDWTPFGENR